MKLIILQNPPLVIDHEKAIEIKTRYLKGEKLATLQNEYDFKLEPKKDYVLIH